MTWCECTSKMNSSPESACAHAGTSSVLGTENVPPGLLDGGALDGGEVDREVVDADRREAPEHAARLKTVSAAATPPAPRRNARRSMAARCAARSTSASVASKMSRSWGDGASGTN